VTVHDGALNNAQWCDIVCRSHGLPTRFDDDLWLSLRRSPPWYPDVVTLRPGVPARHVLSRVDASAGCSVKDSFADLDLTSAGFRVLFEAQWVHRPPAPAPTPAGPSWLEVTDPEQLRTWILAHGGGGNLRESALDHPLVTVFGAYDGDALVAGAIMNRSDGFVGLSNVFGIDLDPAQVWPGAVAAVSARHPGEPLVGYEDGASLEAARAVGFVAAGPLRVWVND
jgi:hypothetical protein